MDQNGSVGTKFSNTEAKGLEESADPRFLFRIEGWGSIQTVRPIQDNGMRDRVKNVAICAERGSMKRVKDVQMPSKHLTEMKCTESGD